MLTWLLDRNPENRMAFEYLESWFLLTKQLPKFMEPIGKLKAFGYTELPRHYEEAMLIYAYGSRKRIDIQGFKPSGQLQKRAAEFNKVVALSVTDRRAAVDQIRNRFPGTYFYYYFCVQPEKRR